MPCCPFGHEVEGQGGAVKKKKHSKGEGEGGGGDLGRMGKGEIGNGPAGLAGKKLRQNVGEKEKGGLAFGALIAPDRPLAQGSRKEKVSNEVIEERIGSYISL